MTDLRSGTLCVVDRQPRELDAEQKEALKSLRRLAVGQMELRRNLVMLKEALNDRTKEEHARELELAESSGKIGPSDGIEAVTVDSAETPMCCAEWSTQKGPGTRRSGPIFQ